MVIHNLYIVGIAVFPNKADPPLAIDTNTVLSLPATRELFQMIGGWHAQILQIYRRLKHFQLSTGTPYNITGKIPGMKIIKQPLRCPALERFDHEIILTLFVNNVNRHYLSQHKIFKALNHCAD